MSCRICGSNVTVRSHIIPKAFAHDVRDGEKHIVAGSLMHKGAKPSQGGAFSDDLLCSAHENITAVIDKYAIEFVRRISHAWGNRNDRVTLHIDNPQPQLLKSFAMLTIWREVHSRQLPSLSLGKYDEALGRHIFEAAQAPDWAVIVQRTNFIIPGRGAADFNLHPYRIRFADRVGWSLTVAGVCFFVVSDQRGLPAVFADWRADHHDPAVITISEPNPLAEVGALKRILAAMAARH